jgi:hypothetical protein
MTAAVRADTLFACIGTPLAHERMTAADISRRSTAKIVHKCNYLVAIAYYCSSATHACAAAWAATEPIRSAVVESAGAPD